MTSSRSQPMFKAVSASSGTLTTEQVVAQVREMINRGELHPGDKLPPERELARRLGISRPSLRTGLRFLAAMGILYSKHGAGTFIADGPPSLHSEPLSLLAALHGFTADEMFESRRVLEVSLAALAAERASDEDLARIADEMTEMYASLDDPQQYLIHDVRFHRAVASASGNPILTALVEMVTAGLYDRRRQTVNRATDLKRAADSHRRIYRAIRNHDPDEARVAMSEHLLFARRAFHSEETGRTDSRKPRPASGAAASPDQSAIRGNRSTPRRARPKR